MAMVSLPLSQQCLLEHHDHHPGRYTLDVRPHSVQLKLSLREALQDGYRCELIQRRLGPHCQLRQKTKNSNLSNSSYEKAFGSWLLRTCNHCRYKAVIGSDILYKPAEALCDAHGRIIWEQPGASARIFASLDSDDGKRDGARKALEQAFQGKNTVAKKWEEEIRKRELVGGDGVGGGDGGGGRGGGGWGGGGGDEDMGEGFGQDERWDWEEAGQTFMATFTLIILYFSITKGPKQVFRLFKLFFRYIRQGFTLRKIPDEYLQGPEDESEDEYWEGDSDDDSEDDYVQGTWADTSNSNSRKENVQKVHPRVVEAEQDKDEDEDEDDELYNVPTPPIEREEKRRKLQAEQNEKIRQLLTPKELRQREEKK